MSSTFPRTDRSRVFQDFGILKAGAAFVPLNPALPRERLVEMLATARPKVAITRRSDLPAGYTIVRPDGLG